MATIGWTMLGDSQPLHAHHEPISTRGQSLDVPRLIRRIPQYPPQRF